MKPAILVSYVALDRFRKYAGSDRYRSWVMDSGAYSALTSGAVIDLHRFTDEAAGLIATDARLKAVFSLDVIGDPEATAKNAEYMWSQGVESVPTFHLGSDWPYLLALAKKYPRIALGGMVQRGTGGHGSKLDWRARLKFIEQSFARVWPKWIHGFGITDPRLMRAAPFASVDSITWYYRTGRYGQIQGWGGLPVCRASENKEGVEAAYRMAVEQFLKLEYEIQGLHGHVLKRVSPDPFALCLGVTGPELIYFPEPKASA